MTGKREDYISWEDFFMGVAVLASQRSKDPSRQVGACIVNDENKIIGVGYNGFPYKCHDDEFPWGKDSPNTVETKHFYVCHAELNAILNAPSNKKGCRLYVTLFPCNECAKCIIQSGIREVIFMQKQKKKREEIAAVQRMFQCSGIKTRCFIPGQDKIELRLKTDKEKDGSGSPV